MQNLALRHQVLDGAGDVLDRHLRIDPVLVEQINPVRPQALERAFDGLLDMVRTADETGTTLSRLGVDVPAELAGDDDFVPERCNGVAKNPFAFKGTVGFRSVEKSDAAIVGRTDDVDHFGARRNRGLIRPMHILDTQTDAGDFQLSELAPGTDLSGRG